LSVSSLSFAVFSDDFELGLASRQPTTDNRQLFQCANTVAEILKLDPLSAQEEAIFRNRFGKFHPRTPPLTQPLLPSSSQSQSDEKIFGINMT
jgi:hypothetical protein